MKYSFRFYTPTRADAVAAAVIAGNTYFVIITFISLSSFTSCLACFLSVGVKEAFGGDGDRG